MVLIKLLPVKGNMGKAKEEDKRSKPENRYLIVVITWVIIFLWANNQRLWALIYTLKEREM